MADATEVSVAEVEAEGKEAGKHIQKNPAIAGFFICLFLFRCHEIIPRLAFIQ